MLRRLKNFAFHQIRRHYIHSHYQDLKNYLKNVEVKEGINSLLGKSILVVCPHPDDEAIGCGGTLKLLTKQNTVVDVLFVTDGESATGMGASPAEKKIMATQREEEAKKSQAILGIRTVFRLGAKDGQLHQENELKNQLREFFSKNTYDVLFCPWEFDGHSDHGATFRALKNALLASPQNPKLWFYETWSPLLANHCVGIDTTFPEKARAIEAYKSQTTLVDYISKIEGLAKYRSLLSPKNQFVEAFFVTDKRLFKK